jgi:hypothetical protein
MDLRTSNTAQPHGTAWLRDDRHSFLLAGMMSVLIVLMIVPEGLDYESLHATGAPASGGIVSRMLWLGLLLLGGTVALSRANLSWLLLRFVNPRARRMAVMVAVASIVWSSTARWCAPPRPDVAIVLACLAFVSVAWHPRRFQNVLRPIVLRSWRRSPSASVFPSLAIQSGIHRTARRSTGSRITKNGLGALSCISPIFWFMQDSRAK